MKKYQSNILNAYSFNEKNSEDIEEEKEKEEELKDNELKDIENNNINKKDNIGNENNEEKNCAKTN